MNRPPKREAANKAREAIRQLALNDSSSSINFVHTQPNPAGPPVSYSIQIQSQNTSNSMNNQSSNDYSFVNEPENQGSRDSFHDLGTNDQQNSDNSLGTREQNRG